VFDSTLLSAGVLAIICSHAFRGVFLLYTKRLPGVLTLIYPSACICCGCVYDTSILPGAVLTVVYPGALKGCLFASTLVM
jgi:hypothetical protein